MDNMIKYEVWNKQLDKNCGYFKSLELGIAQIRRTCETWGWNISKFQILDIKTKEVVWDGLVDGSSVEVPVNR